MLIYCLELNILDRRLEIWTRLEVQHACSRSALAQAESLVEGLGFDI